MPKNLLFEAKPGLLVHEWTRQTRAVPLASAGPARPEGRMRAVAASAAPIALEERGPMERSALETLARRRSVRHYAAAPLALAELGRVLALGAPRAAALGPSAHTRLRPWREQRPGCAIFPLVMRVEGLAPGGYMYDPAAHQLVPVRLEDPLPLLQDACFQREFTGAPALLLLAGSLAEHHACYGERGYRALLLDTGVTLQRLYFAASTLGLGGSATGSLVQDQLSAWLGLDGFNGAVLMGFALGHPAGGAQA